MGTTHTRHTAWPTRSPLHCQAACRHRRRHSPHASAPGWVWGVKRQDGEWRRGRHGKAAPTCPQTHVGSPLKALLPSLWHWDSRPMLVLELAHHGPTATGLSLPRPARYGQANSPSPPCLTCRRHERTPGQLCPPSTACMLLCCHEASVWGKGQRDGQVLLSRGPLAPVCCDCSPGTSVPSAQEALIGGGW